MRVLSVAFPTIPVGTAIAAGAEQVLSTLDAGLIERRHENIVIAAAGSKTSGQLVESSNHRETIDRVLAADSHASRTDLIHFHGLDFPQYLPDTRVPMLATLHLPVSFYSERTIEECRSRGIFFNCVSSSQVSSSPLLDGLPVVVNGIATQFYVSDEPGGGPASDAEGSERYIVWLGRICPEKGTHIALETASSLDVPIVIAGPVHAYAAHQDYFSQYVEPLLAGYAASGLSSDSIRSG